MKTVTNPALIFDNLSFAATFTATLPELFDYYGLALQFNFSAANTIAGALKLQVSLDGVNFADYTGLTPIAAFNVTQIWFIDNKIFPFKHAQLVFTRTSGTGTADAYLTGCRV